MQSQQGHRESGIAIRRQRQVVATVNRNLVGQLQVFAVEATGIVEQSFALDLVGFGIRRELQDRNALQQRRQRLQARLERQAAGGHLVSHTDQRRNVFVEQRVEHGEQVVVADRAQHVDHLLLANLAGPVGDRLVEQRQGVAHRTVGGPRQVPQCGGLEGDRLGLEDALQMLDDVQRRHLLEIELQAARQHRHRNLLRIGGGQDEFDVFGRLFEGLQHRVEGMPGEHVYLVDHIDLVTALDRRIYRLV